MIWSHNKSVHLTAREYAAGDYGVDYRIANTAGEYFGSNWLERGGDVLPGSKARKRVYLESI